MTAPLLDSAPSPLALGATRQQLLTCGLQPVNDNSCHASHQFVPEIMVLFTLFPKPGTIKEDGRRWFQGTSIEVPIVRLKKPRPPKDITGTDDLNLHRGMIL